MDDLEEKIKAARGEGRANLLLKNANLINVLSGEIYPADVAIYGDTIVGIGRYEAEREMDLGGKFLCPGFIDAHVHIESSMVTPPEYARAVVCCPRVSPQRRWRPLGHGSMPEIWKA
jgi:adenine deaminase